MDRQDVAALVEELRRGDHDEGDANPCAVRYGEACNCGVALHNTRVDRLAAALDGMAREVETLRADLVATRMERDGALARIRMAEAAAADARSRIKQAGADTRRVLAEAEAKIGAATARAVAAEEALARVSERLAMACQFYVANSDVYVLRSPAGWRVLKPQSPLLDELYLNAFGIWETGSHKEPPHQFDSVDAALAALAVSRG